MTARAVAAAGNCNTCGLPIDKATIVGIDGVDLPIVMSVKDRHGVHHYNCWQGFAPQQRQLPGQGIVSQAPAIAALAPPRHPAVPLKRQPHAEQG